MTKGRILFFVCFLMVGQAFAQVDAARRGAAITLKVPSFNEAQTQLLTMISRHHGVAGDRHQTSSPGGRINGWTRVIVPKTELDAFLADVGGLGKEYGEKTNLVDGSSTYEDLGKRAERLREHENRLSSILTGRKGLRGSDILFVQERFYRASTDEDTLTEQREAIPARAAKSSVVVTFFEPAIVKEEPHGVAGRVKATFEEAMRSMAFTLLSWVSTVLNLLVLSVILAMFWLIFRRPLRTGLIRLKGFVNANLKPKEDQPISS